MGPFRNGSVLVGVPVHRHPVNLAEKPLDDHRRDVSTTVGTIIDDESLLVELRIVPSRELVQSLRSHIRDIDVAHLAAGFLLDGADVPHHPLVVLKRIFIGDRLDNDLAPALGGRLVDGQFDKFVSFSDKEPVDVVNVLKRLSVNGRDEIALGDIHSRFGQR